MNSYVPSEFLRRLKAEMAGPVHGDVFTRGRYATDASIYQMMPAAVAIPRDVEDIRTALALAREFEVPMTPRGGGTSQCGQTVNRGLILDNSRHLNGLLELDVEAARCVVQPGIVLDELNRLLKPHGLWFPVDVSTASRATIGGMAANNSCGQRSIHYGTMRHNVHAIDAILPSGEQFHFGEVPVSLEGLAGEQRALVQELLSLGAHESANIQERFPSVLRRVGGYNIDALMPYEYAKGGAMNARHSYKLADLLVGSEGTLAYSTAIELKLWPLPQQRVLGICHFPGFYEAMDATQHLVELGPHAVELVDNTMVALARDIDLYRDSVAEFVRGDPAALLIVEFAFETEAENLRHLRLLHERMADLGFSWKGQGKSWGGVVEAIDPGMQARIGEVRKAGLNIMMSMKAEGKPVSFVEDCAVDLPDLAEYTAALTEVFNKHGTPGTWYAHASVGCLHVRPVLNMKLEKDANTMRQIAEEAFDLVLKYKGSHSGEHGDGISRSEFHTKMFGEQMVKAFETIKRHFDPQNLFNPGKIVNAPRMNDRELFRYQPGYRMVEIKQQLDWSAWPGASGGLQGAIEMCNNNGACRKTEGGVMCPSYRVTRDEQHVTRGRANTLRLAMSGQLGEEAMSSDAMHETMKLCVSCKACKRECPTGVDMARMKIEVMAARARKHGYSLQQRLVAHLPRYALLAFRLRWLFNLRNTVPALASMSESLVGFSAQRKLPVWASRPFMENDSVGDGSKEVVLLADTFNTWFEPENLREARVVLRAAGYRVHLAQSPGQRKLCCGRTYLATGMVDQARLEAQRMVDALLPWVQKGVPVVGLEPSCLLTLRDEFKALLPGPSTQLLADNAFLLEELIVRDHEAGTLDWNLSAPVSQVLVHGHCHQKALGAFSAVQKTLALIPGLTVSVVDSSCCGMAGAFGYGRDTAAVSMQMAELSLLPAVRDAEPDTLIVADGTSCRHQISDGAGRDAIHVVHVLAMALRSAEAPHGTA
ncbi:FAD-binding and (Fe-S)-binding domain-containing protein [Granulosicoccus antarcticus]|uniref:Anaerobic glycerol-3-phosphate dehydrogenase subunit C n=1 Tax=Granulosicoccus antarcticus IMCC3135 TaxID=1192854 RepID=A0A2Z2NML8_9GAMM|nr:FAD-binding and (Fe-S)-binding domain-containing protein [Granulosicoccus antarcticus]ASJ70978.1 Anaerobic glycerol-3-phosphate dehydrogenase subunit C [Granulosicoccus antarcticus IMCC3135]